MIFLPAVPGSGDAGQMDQENEILPEDLSNQVIDDFRNDGVHNEIRSVVEYLKHLTNRMMLFRALMEFPATEDIHIPSNGHGEAITIPKEIQKDNKNDSEDDVASHSTSNGNT